MVVCQETLQSSHGDVFVDGDGCIDGDTGTHLPASGVVVGHSPCRGASYNRVAAAVTAFEHPLSVSATGVKAAGCNRLGGAVGRHGEGEAGAGEAGGDGDHDGLLMSLESVESIRSVIGSASLEPSSWQSLV